MDLGPERASAPAEAREVKFTLPADWSPSEAGRNYASDKGLDPANVAETFTDYFTNGRGKREKRTAEAWEKRWRIWCNRDAETRPGGGKTETFNERRIRLGREALRDTP